MKKLKFETYKDIPKIEKRGAVIEFDPQEEDIHPIGQFDNDEEAQKICDRYNDGNMAAWFCAKVKVTFKDFQADDYLGCCSYGSFKEFTEEKKGYYIDMIRQCVQSINEQIQEHNERVKRHWDIRRAKNLVQPYGYSIIHSMNLEKLIV